MRYMIVSEKDLQDLAKKVNTLLQNGWKLNGPVLQYDDDKYHQALTRDRARKGK